MKLAHLSTRFPPGPGGVERHVAEVTRRLAARGHSVTVYTTDLYREFPWERLPTTVPRAEERQRVSVRRLRVWSLPGELHYPFVRGLGAVLRRDRPELVHAHTYGTHHAAVARRYSRRTRVPFVLSAHYHPIWSIEGGWLRHRIRGFYDRALADPIVREADCVIVQSREEERLLRAPGVTPARVALIPPGYSPLTAPPAEERAFARTYGIPGPFLLFVGRLASNKGLLELVEAFRPLAERDPTATLVIAGADGGMGPALLEKIRARGLASRVRLTGFVEEERLLASGFREARIFVLPSAYEAFGLVLLESLAQGTPVVATRVGGVPEFIEDGRAGLLVPPGDSVALAQAIRSLWEDEARRRALGRYGQTEVVPRYSWDRVVDRLQQVYEEVQRR